MRQQPALALKAACVAGEGTVAADDAMARNDDGQRIAADGGTDGPDSGGGVDMTGELTVGPGLAGGDAFQGLPHLLLKRGAGDEVQR